MILGIALILIGAAATYHAYRVAAATREILREVADGLEQVRTDALATRKQAKEALRLVRKTEAHADRILERAYVHQQEINAFMANPNVRAATRHSESNG